jgi:hypothetical protein
MKTFALSYAVAIRRREIQLREARRPSQGSTRPVVGIRDFADWAADVGNRFAERGVVEVRHELAVLKQLAEQYGVAASVRDLLTDRRADEIVRARAFLRVVRAVQQAMSAPADSSATAA